MQKRSAAEVVGLAAEEEVEIVDLRFCDLPGLMQHFSVPVHALTEDAFGEGYGFDGSSIRGFQSIEESDMILLPDPSTAVIDEFPSIRRSTSIDSCMTRSRWSTTAGILATSR
ncbi:MAG TPA: glutamine synthetase [Acidimicrobiales bacterium]|nr:glutamine synthetase [Acidimicrobiales bacterium]